MSGEFGASVGLGVSEVSAGYVQAGVCEGSGLVGL